MLSHLRPAVALLVGFTVLTGVLYPLAITGIAGVVALAAASGSLVEVDGKPVGSSLIGQDFVKPGYLHPRPSATGYNAASSGATNLGPTSAALIASVAEKQAAYQAENGVAGPIDAVTTSGSGLDPDISPENARDQTGRIAAARGVDPAAVEAVIDAEAKGKWLGLYGEPRVNVLAVNLALDAAFPIAGN